MKIEEMSYFELQQVRALALDYIKVEADSDRRGTRRYVRPVELEALSLVVLHRIDEVLIKRFKELLPYGDVALEEDLNAVSPDGNAVFSDNDGKFVVK